MSPFSGVTGNRKGLRNLKIREEREPSDGKSHPLELSVFCAKSSCCSDDSWKNQYFVKSLNPSLNKCLDLFRHIVIVLFASNFSPFRMKL